MDFEKLYQEVIESDGDFAGHMETIYNLLDECNHVTELGVGNGQSTKAFLRKEGLVLHSYEIEPLPEIIDLFTKAKEAGRDATLHIADTTKVEIEETDLLLVDSYHSYKQVKKELDLHGSKVRKYIVFHDTELYGFIGQGYNRTEDNFELGIIPAIDDFVKNSEFIWETVYHTEECNGLTIIKRNHEHNVKIVAHDWHVSFQEYDPIENKLKEIKYE